MTDFSPREIVSALDRFIIGQGDARRAVAIALRSYWQRMKLDVLIGPSLANLRAIRDDKKAGFRREREVDAPDGIALLMVRNA
jgi:hypothetical protein